MSRSSVACIIRGQDKPGIAEAFMDAIQEHDCQLKDITQFLLEGLLVFTFVLDVGEQSSFRLMKDLRRRAEADGLDLEFHFPDDTASDKEKAEKDSSSGEEQATDACPTSKRSSCAKIAVLEICSLTSIAASSLCAVDRCLAQAGCVVESIEHRSDNKIENNGEVNKVSIQVRCPPKCTLAALYMGIPREGGGAPDGLLNVDGVHVSLRWSDALNRVSGKSLVVFGLSDVLCPYDVLDELLREAGVEASAIQPVKSEDALNPARKSKVAMLKGKSVKAASSLIERLEFTKGARLVCSTLKSMGCRLAILTNTGERSIASYVKQQLGIDYNMCQNLAVEDGCFTGEYEEEVADLEFRKLDLMKLMADREGIEYRNVIAVGDVLKGLKSGNARLLLETFGSNVFFDASKTNNLSIVLYQLGFNGSHVKTLRDRYDSEAQPSVPATISKPDSSEIFTVEVTAPTRKPGQLGYVFESLKRHGSSATISTMRQCSLQNGGMCLGLKLVVQATGAEQVMKDLLYDCQKTGLRARWDQSDRAWAGAEGDFHNRHVITMVQQPTITIRTFRTVLSALAKLGVNVVNLLQLSMRSFRALQIAVTLPEGLSRATVAESLVKASNELGCDIAFQPDDVDRFMRRMIVFDMDSTLIQQEVIDELARIAGVEAEVSAITEAAMRGEIDFFGSLKKRVAMLKGANCEELFREAKKAIYFNPGAQRLCSVLHNLGYKMAVISGGFLPVAEEVQRKLGLDYAFANSLEVDEQTGLLTGETCGPVVTPQRKRALLATISNVEDCSITQTIAVGDGSNDIPMLHTAGLGIAFCAKPKVQAVTEFRINQKDLSEVLFLIGVSEHAAVRLAEHGADDARGAPLVEDGAPAKRQRTEL